LFLQNVSNDRDYGPSAQRPDIDEETMTKESEEFLKKLEKSEIEIEKIERETVHQSDSYEEMRRNLLTASNFGRVCKMRPQTGCESIVKQMLHSAFDCDAMAYGRNNEETARQEVAIELGVTIKKCGLFICKESPFLGATPDGLINDDSIVEIKCPASAKDMAPDEAIKKGRLHSGNSQKVKK